jgi:hypothetical protein
LHDRALRRKHACPRKQVLKQGPSRVTVSADNPSDITALAQQHSAEAVAVLVEALNHPGERVEAARALLAIAWGQPLLPITIDSTTGIVVEFHDAQPPFRRANDEDKAARHKG